MASTFDQVLLIDDDPIHNFIATNMVRKFFNPDPIDVVSFLNPEEGIKYIQTEIAATQRSTILFLDINMPQLTGWEVLDKIRLLSVHVLSRLTIYVLSSSIDPSDLRKASRDLLVKGFLSKPLAPHLQKVLAVQQTLTT